MRVLGVRVGKVGSITPRAGDVKVTLDVDRSTAIPADARAVVVAQSLVSGRFVRSTWSTRAESSSTTAARFYGAHRCSDGVDDVKKQLLESDQGDRTRWRRQGIGCQATDVADKNLQGNGEVLQWC